MRPDSLRSTQMKMPAGKPILQKGDEFRVPEHRAPVRYLAETLRCDRRGRGTPKFSTTMKWINQAEVEAAKAAERQSAS